MSPKPQMRKVCTRCRQRRKRCDRLSPQCSLCARNGWNCAYPDSSSEDIGSQDLQQWSDAVAFPAVYFLDASLFHQCQLELPRDKLPIPPYINDFLGDSASIRDLSTSYFNSVHLWMPIISRRRIYHHIINPLSQPRADLALLVIAMRLIMWAPSSSARNMEFKSDLYRATKKFHRDVEMAGLLTLPILQAGILITLYEFGHGIYPSAYYSIGACTRYGVLLGIDRAAMLSADRSPLWVEVEEKRRVWWAVLILDRSISLGSPLHSLATEDPKSKYILPVDDALFDQGTSPPQKFHTLSSSATLEMGRFARFAQATHLLGRVLRHVSDANVDEEFRAEERIQLYRTLSALASITLLEGQAQHLEFCTQTATCYCAVLALQESHYSNGEEVPSGILHELQSKISTEVIARNVATISRKFQSGGSVLCQSVSPFILHLLYRSAAVFTANSKLAEESDTDLVILKQNLELLRGRWGAAGAYMDILEARELM